MLSDAPVQHGAIRGLGIFLAVVILLTFIWLLRGGGGDDE